MYVCVVHFIVRCPASCLKARGKQNRTVESRKDKVACLDFPSVKSCKSVNSVLVTLSVCQLFPNQILEILKPVVQNIGITRKLQSIALVLMGTFCLLPNGDTVAQNLDLPIAIYSKVKK